MLIVSQQYVWENRSEWKGLNLMPVLRSQTLYATSYLFHYTMLIDLVSLLSVWQTYSLDFFQVSLIGRSGFSGTYYKCFNDFANYLYRSYCAKRYHRHVHTIRASYQRSKTNFAAVLSLGLTLNEN